MRCCPPPWGPLVVVLALLALPQPGRLDCLSRTHHTQARDGDSLVITNGPGSYPPLTECEWLVEATHPNSTIELVFSAYATECQYDYVFVYEGASRFEAPLVAALSGNTLPAPITTRGQMLVVLYSDTNYVLAGINATATVQACNTTCNPQHGACVAGLCTCRPGWSGPTCSDEVCPSGCSGHGRCSPVAAACVCDDGFAGADCGRAAPIDAWGSVAQLPHSHGLLSHASVYVDRDDSLYVFFGQVLGRGPSPDVWRFSFSSQSWALVLGTGGGPEARASHTCVAHGGGVFLYGGTTARGLSNELWLFDPNATATANTAAWTLWSPAAVCSNLPAGLPGSACYRPPALSGHAAAAYDDAVFVSGGQTPTEEIHRDFYVFNITTATWRRFPGTAQTQLIGHSAVFHPDLRSVVVFGGYRPLTSRYSERSDDVLWYHVDEVHWNLVAPREPVQFRVPGLAFHSAVLLRGDVMLVFGGTQHTHGAEEVCYHPEVLLYHVSCNTWQATAAPAGGPAGGPAGRNSHSAFLRGDTLYAVGGFRGVGLSDVSAFHPASGWCSAELDNATCLLTSACGYCATSQPSVAALFAEAAVSEGVLLSDAALGLTQDANASSLTECLALCDAASPSCQAVSFRERAATSNASVAVANATTPPLGPATPPRNATGNATAAGNSTSPGVMPLLAPGTCRLSQLPLHCAATARDPTANSTNATDTVQTWWRKAARGVGCATACPDGSFWSSNTSCTPCAPNCTACTSLTECSACRPGHGLLRQPASTTTTTGTTSSGSCLDPAACAALNLTAYQRGDGTLLCGNPNATTTITPTPTPTIAPTVTTTTTTTTTTSAPRQCFAGDGLDPLGSFLALPGYLASLIDFDVHSPTQSDGATASALLAIDDDTMTCTRMQGPNPAWEVDLHQLGWIGDVDLVLGPGSDAAPTGVEVAVLDASRGSPRACVPAPSPRSRFICDHQGVYVRVSAPAAPVLELCDVVVRPSLSIGTGPLAPGDACGSSQFGGVWTPGACPGHCLAHTTCPDCAANLRCGWDATAQSCVEAAAAVTTAAAHSLTVDPTVCSTARPQAGLTVEQYFRVSPWTLAGLRAQAARSQFPDKHSVTRDFELEYDPTRTLGVRVHGFLVPPRNATYRLWVRNQQGHAVELWLNAAGPSLDGAAIVASGAYVPSRPQTLWDRWPSQASAPVALTAGARYYIEAVAILFSGQRLSRTVGVAWTTGNTTRATDADIIPQAALRPYESGNCSSITNCYGCTAAVDCGFCPTTGRCLAVGSPAAALCPRVYSAGEQCPSCDMHVACGACLADPTCEWLFYYCRRRSGYSEAVVDAGKCPVPCHTHTGCSSCTERSECAWCESSQTCFAFSGYLSQFANGQCIAWQTRASQCVACDALTTCSACQQEPRCGWCHDTADPTKGVCALGDFGGPASGGQPLGLCALPGNLTATNASATGVGNATMGNTSSLAPPYNGRWAYDTCPEVDECRLGYDDCAAAATCRDLPGPLGAFACVCDPGYTGDGRGADGCQAVCTNCVHGECLAPPNTCNCSAGWVGPNCTACISPHPECHPSATCANGPGNALECTCPAGYEGDGRTACQPMCMPGCQGNCSLPQTCDCFPGFRGALCAECDGPPEAFGCHPNATCRGAFGDAECACAPGFAGNGSWCEPVCSHCAFGTCVAPGTCRCNPGVAGPACSECDPSALLCDAAALCGLNASAVGARALHRWFNGTAFAPLAPGSVRPIPPTVTAARLANASHDHYCACGQGWRGSGVPGPGGCEPLCTRGCVNGDCEYGLVPDAANPNASAWGTCRCRTGFGGIDCTECDPANDLCALDASCVASGPGASRRRCQCDYGFEGDGNVACRLTCVLECVHGTCNAPECVCDPGWHGVQCELPCPCNNHSVCDGAGICTECTHNTLGANCEACAPGFVGNATSGSVQACVPCLDVCNGQSRLCSPAEIPESTVCTGCASPYMGARCDECASGFYASANGSTDDAAGTTCLPCPCNGHGGACNPRTGLGCVCDADVASSDPQSLAHQCDQCAEGRVGPNGTPALGPGEECLIVVAAPDVEGQVAFEVEARQGFMVQRYVGKRVASPAPLSLTLRGAEDGLVSAHMFVSGDGPVLDPGNCSRAGSCEQHACDTGPCVLTLSCLDYDRFVQALFVLVVLDAPVAGWTARLGFAVGARDPACVRCKDLACHDPCDPGWFVHPDLPHTCTPCQCNGHGDVCTIANGTHCGSLAALCNPYTGRNCACAHNTESEARPARPHLGQCTRCAGASTSTADYTDTDAGDGRPCYRILTNGQRLEQVLEPGEALFVSLRRPFFTNIGHHIILDVFASAGEARYFVASDPALRLDASSDTVEPSLNTLRTGTIGELQRITLSVDPAEHRSEALYLAVLGDSSSPVEFAVLNWKAEQASIDLIVFFSVFFSCFFLVTATAIVGWQATASVRRRRVRAQRALELQAMSRRPLATVTLAPLALASGRARPGLGVASGPPTPIAQQLTSGLQAEVASFLVVLPGARALSVGAALVRTRHRRRKRRPRRAQVSVYETPV